MFALLIADLKMMLRNRQALFWTLAFPLMFTFIFGAFFGKNSGSAGTVILIQNSKSSLSTTISDSLKKSSLFKIQEETALDSSKDLVKNGKAVAIIDIPPKFGDPSPDSATSLDLYYDQGSLQAEQVVSGFLNSILTSVNFKIQNAKPIYSVKEIKTTQSTAGYFDFILVGLIGMALMNGSVQGVAISMSKYREDKILKRINSTPLPSSYFILAELISRLLLAIVQITLIILVGTKIFGAHIIGSYWTLYALSLLGSLLFQSIGFAVAGLSKTTDAADGMATAVTIPMMFLAGVFFPIDSLPTWIHSIVQYLPLAPLLRMMRGSALESTSAFSVPSNIIIVIIWILITLLIAIYKFRLREE